MDEAFFEKMILKLDLCQILQYSQLNELSTVVF